MSKSRKICIVYTETNGLHTTNEDVSKKNLYCFARLVVLNYEIGYRENNKFISTKKVRTIIKPRCMNITEDSIKIHNITMDKAINEGSCIENTLDIFLKDIADVTVIVSHNIEFHLKTIISEFVRYNKYCNFSNFIIIDTISFFHSMVYPKLDVLLNSLNIKKANKDITNLEKIRRVFIKLYENYENSILLEKK